MSNCNTGLPDHFYGFRVDAVIRDNNVDIIQAASDISPLAFEAKVA